MRISQNVSMNEPEDRNLPEDGVAFYRAVLFTLAVDGVAAMLIFIAVKAFA